MSGKDTSVPDNWDELFEYEITREILMALRRNPDVTFTPSEIVEQVGMNEASFYRRIDILTESGLVTKSREGRQTYYQYDNESNIAEALDLIDYELQRQAERQA